MSMRKACLSDLNVIFELVWANIDEFATGKPCQIVTREYLKNLILGTYGDGIWCSDNCDAVMGYSIVPDGFSSATNCVGLFLVSGKAKSGFKLAVEVLAWVKSQGYIPSLIAKSKMINFYKRIGLNAAEMVFTAE